MHSNNLFLVPKPNVTSKVRLFCFPYAGGGVGTYLPWADKLPSFVELIAVQPPGRAARISEKPYSDMRDLINYLIKYAHYFSEKPYVLFGHSLGAKVAYELSATLTRLGYEQPRHLIISGSGAPHIPSMREPLSKLPEREFMEKLAQLNGTPKEILENKELMSLLSPLIRADFNIADTYKPELTPIPTPITVLGGTEDTGVTEELREGWFDLTSNPKEMHCIEGDHFFVEQNQERVIECVNKVLLDTSNELHFMRNIAS